MLSGHQTRPAGKQTKGERTRQRILDVAEELFANRGYEGTSLRQIARAAGIQEPGLYNHFAGKQVIYQAVLDRALYPLVEVLASHIDDAAQLRDFTDLPSVMTDLLTDHPTAAPLLQQAVQGDEDSVGTRLVMAWLDRLFNEGTRALQHLVAPESAGPVEQDRRALAINLIAMLNLVTGYFLSQRAFGTMADGNLRDPDNIARQKQLLHKVIRAMLVN
ncbi:MAG: helix-turn-helix domain-containing protein [Halioglobus sp.]|nr:helix-turn-helix domain-containing protein [Halioglobus sp.]